MKSQWIFAYIAISFVLTVVGYSSSEKKIITETYENEERLIKIELLYKLGSDKENEDFYEPRSFTVDSEGRIYILDQ